MSYIFNTSDRVVGVKILRAKKEITLSILPKCKAVLKSYDEVPEKSKRQKSLKFYLDEEKNKIGSDENPENNSSKKKDDRKQFRVK